MPRSKMKNVCPLCRTGVVLNRHTQRIHRHCSPSSGQWCAMHGVTLDEAARRVEASAESSSLPA